MPLTQCSEVPVLIGTGSLYVIHFVSEAAAERTIGFSPLTRVVIPLKDSLSDDRPVWRKSRTAIRRFPSHEVSPLGESKERKKVAKKERKLSLYFFTKLSIN
jgi:hypothetical protein